MGNTLTLIVLFYSLFNSNNSDTWSTIEEKTWISLDIGFGACAVFYQTNNHEKKAIISFGGSGIHSIAVNCYDVTITDSSIELRSTAPDSHLSFISLHYNSDSNLLTSTQEELTFKMLFSEPKIYLPANELVDMRHLKDGSLLPCK